MRLFVEQPLASPRSANDVMYSGQLLAILQCFLFVFFLSEKKNISETSMEEGSVEAKLKEILRYNKYDQIYVVSYHYGRLLSVKTTLYG